MLLTSPCRPQSPRVVSDHLRSSPVILLNPSVVQLPPLVGQLSSPPLFLSRSILQPPRRPRRPHSAPPSFTLLPPQHPSSPPSSPYINLSSPPPPPNRTFAPPASFVSPPPYSLLPPSNLRLSLSPPSFPSAPKHCLGGCWSSQLEERTRKAWRRESYWAIYWRRRLCGSMI